MPAPIRLPVPPVRVEVAQALLLPDGQQAVHPPLHPVVVLLHERHVARVLPQRPHDAHEGGAPVGVCRLVADSEGHGVGHSAGRVLLVLDHLRVVGVEGGEVEAGQRVVDGQTSVTQPAASLVALRAVGREGHGVGELRPQHVLLDSG